MAPKTQEEFLASVTLPDSVVFEPVYLELQLSNGIQLMLEQNGNDIGSAREIKRQFYQPNRKAKLFNLLLAVFTFETPEYQPQIRLEASNAELTSIYRALPIQPKVVISYN